MARARPNRSLAVPTQPALAGLRSRSWAQCVLAGGCALALVACQGGAAAGGPAGQEQDHGTAWPVERRYERGAVLAAVQLSAAEVTVADTISLRVTLEGPEALRTQLPDAAELAATDLTVHRVYDDGPALTVDGSVRVSRTFVMRPFLAGEYRIPSLEVGWELAGPGAGSSVVTDELPFRVVSVVGDQPPSLLDAGVPQRAPLRWWRLVALALAAGGIAVVALRGYRRWRRARPQARAPELSPAQLALRALADLERSELLPQGDLKTFHTVVSDIVRRYVEDRFGVRARERTTDEFLRGWQAAGPATGAGGSGPQSDALRRFLQQCDLVKFARAAPTQAASAALITTARRFVETDDDAA